MGLMFPQGMLAQNKILLLDDDEQMLELYQALIEQMVRLNILPPAANGPDGCCAPEPFLAEVGYSTAGSPLRLRFLLENATYVMKTPMLFYDISRKYLQ